MEIKRVTDYNNPIFSQIVLNQRGAFLIDEEPYEIEIISSDSAFVKYQECSENNSFPTSKPRVLRYFIKKTAVVLVFPSAKTCICHSLDTKRAKCFIMKKNLAEMKREIRKLMK